MLDLPENIFKIIFEKSPGSLLVKADFPRFTILAASDSYLTITSSTRESIVGKGFFEVFPEDKDNYDNNTIARNVFTSVAQTGQKVDVPNYRFDVYNEETKNYEKRYWSCSNTPIFNRENTVAYILNTVVEITAEVKAKEFALESENRLRMAAEATALANWDLDMRDMTFICSPRLAEIFGHPTEHVITLEDIRKQVNADDMENIVLKAYEEALITGNYLYEARIYWPDGSLHWIKTQGIVLSDDKNKPFRMLGTILDITESKSDEIRKNDFIAMASHELKTPLTSLKAYLQILLKKMEAGNDSFVINALSKADYQVDKMTNLIHSFLDISRLEPGKLQLKAKEFEINKLIEETITDIRHNTHSHLINFGELEKFFVNADKEKIGQVISNFLSNAIKYSDKGSIITVSSKRINDSVQVSVTDEGIGIRHRDQEKLFQRFFRVENDKMKTISGFGIGLYLASEIIQRHKGQIWVESEEGQGSTFYFSLPLAAGQD